MIRYLLAILVTFWPLYFILSYLWQSFSDSLLVTDIKWEIFIHGLIISCWVLSFVTFKLTPYKLKAEKVLSFLLLLMSGYGFIVTLVLDVLYGSDYAFMANAFFVVLYSMIIIALAMYNLRSKLIKESARYSPKGTYTVYFFPKSLTGLFYALLKYPFGGCFVVARGREFKFKKGVVIESAHIESERFIYVKSKHDVFKLRELATGVRWGILSNCLTLFNEKKYIKDQL